MNPEIPIVVSLNRNFTDLDEKAINKLIVKWLVYDVKIEKGSKKAQIALYHSKGAKPALVKELSELFPNERFTSM